MKLPRDLSGIDLAQRLARHGYQITRQTGSHIRLTRRVGEEEFHISIPAHKTLKAGTLSSILTAVAEQLNITRDELLTRLSQ